MNKIKQISQKLLVFLAAVTLVAAVVVPESGQDLLYADTNDIVYEQEISEAQDAENEQKSDTAGTEGTLSSPQMENEDSGSGSAETVPESEGDEESIAEQAINDIAEEADQEKGQPEEYLRQAYDAGHADGYAAGRATNWWTTPITYPTTNPTITWTTEPNDVPNPYKITCDAHNDM